MDDSRNGGKTAMQELNRDGGRRIIDPTRLPTTGSFPGPVDGKSPSGSSLTYIHADAGYGKTTLLMQYARSRTMRPGSPWMRETEI